MIITKILFCITATIIVITSEIAGITLIKSVIKTKDPFELFIGLMFMFSPLVAVAYMLGI